MAILGSTGDKALSAGVTSGAASGLSVAGPVGAVVGAFVGATAGLFAGKSAQNKQDLIDAHNKSRQGIGLMLGIKYRKPVDNSPPAKPGSLAYVLQQAAKNAADAVANGMVPVDTSGPAKDPNISFDAQGNEYYLGVRLVPDTSKFVMPDGSIISHVDFPDYDMSYNLGKLLNSLGYGITLGPILTKGANTDLSQTPYVYTTPNGSKLTADAIHCLYSLGVTISDLSPAAMLASGVNNNVPQNNAPLQASFSGMFGGINPIMIVLIVVLIIFITYKYS